MRVALTLVFVLTGCAASFETDAGSDAITEAGPSTSEAGFGDGAPRFDASQLPPVLDTGVIVPPRPDGGRGALDMAPPPPVDPAGAYRLCDRERPCDEGAICIAFDRGPGSYCAPLCEGACPDHAGPGPAECSSFGQRRACVARCDRAHINTMNGCPGLLVCRDIGEDLGLCAPG